MKRSQSMYSYVGRDHFDAAVFEMPVKTSRDAPYYMDWLPLPERRYGGLLLGMQPGRNDTGMEVIWNRDVTADLERVWLAGVRTIVVTVEIHELRMQGIDRYLDQARAMGFSVIWFPIEDMHVPLSQRLCEDLMGQIHAALDVGSVLIHCRGGKGRTGTVAACYLVTLGVPYEQAIERVRQARKGTVATYGQESFCREFERFYNDRRSCA